MIAPEFRARLITPASVESAFDVTGALTPYDVETLVTNAQNFPHGSRLDVVLGGGANDDLVRALSERFTALTSRGIAVSIRHAPDVTAEEERPTMRTRRILIADDDADMRRMLATLLRMSGHQVVEASDGIDVLERLESTIWHERPDRFDVIVSDINMPGLSGLDFLAALRCAQATTPVILITAYGDADARAEARELGAAAFLDKPLDPEALRRAVAEAAPDAA